MAGGKGLSIEGAVFRPSAHYAIRINIYIYIYIKLSKFYWTPDGIRIEKIISFEP